MEVWTLKKKDMNSLEAFELWSYRREFSELVGCRGLLTKKSQDEWEREKELIKTIKVKKLQYFGHVYQGSKLKYFENNSRRVIFWENNDGKKTNIFD